MDWKTFIADVIGSIAWPATILVAVVMLREPIRELLPNLRKLKYGELQIDFEHDVEMLREDISEEEDFSQLVVPQKTIELAKISPRAAILDTWLDVETASVAAAKRHNLEVNPRFRQIMSIRALFESGFIDESTFNLYRNLRVLRNEAAHMPEREITTEAAVNTCDMCVRVLQKLQNA